MSEQMLVSQSGSCAFALNPASELKARLEYVVRIDGEAVGSYDTRDKCMRAMKAIMDAMSQGQEMICAPANEPFTAETSGREEKK